ncbi:MAG: hypothetical protein VB104_04030 [Candidatus Limiplasma sp.]|nr:hypothetical protein [Candidatus Limiplasma sp.]
MDVLLLVLGIICLIIFLITFYQFLKNKRRLSSKQYVTLAVALLSLAVRLIIISNSGGAGNQETSETHTATITSVTNVIINPQEPADTTTETTTSTETPELTPTPTATPTPTPTLTVKPVLLKEMVHNWTRNNSYDYIYFGCKLDNMPVLWRVLSANQDTLTLLCEKVQAAMQYDKHSSEWRESMLCNWLNTEYMDVTFSESERNTLTLIEENNCVTIPSQNDMRFSGYGFSDVKHDINRIANADSGIWNTALYINTSNHHPAYYTKTPDGGRTVVIVGSDGKFKSAEVTRHDLGVRPMVSLNLDKLVYTSGDGSMDNPYIVEIK